MKHGLSLLALVIFLAACGTAQPIAPTATPGPAVAEALVPNAAPASMVVDAQAVYWSECDAWESTHGTIQAYSIRERTVTTLASDQACPFSLQADDNALYWIDHEDIQGGVHHIFRLDKKGGGPQVVTSDRSVFRTLLLDESHLYWWTEDGTPMRLSKDGRGQPEALPFPAKYIKAFDGADVYWQNANSDLIRSRKDGSAAATLVRGSDFAPATAEGHQISSSIVAVYPRQSQVYFKVLTDGNPGMVSCTDQWTRLMRVGKEGGQAVSVAQAPGYADLILAEPFVYFGGNCLEGISKDRLESSSRAAFLQRPTPVRLLRSDGQFLYWFDPEGDSIERARQ